MRRKINNWLQTICCRKSDGMGTVEVILIICYILTI